MVLRTLKSKLPEAPETLVKREIEKCGISVNFVASESRLLAILRETQRGFIITDSSFAGNYLARAGIENTFNIRREDTNHVREAKGRIRKQNLIIGFGGGRPLDVAKKVAHDLGLELLLVPTAPSHNGIASRTASLYRGSKKESFRCKYPDRLIIPFFLWKGAERHGKAGLLDVFGSIIALQDVYLANRVVNEEIKEREQSLAAASVVMAEKSLGFKSLALSLIAAGLAMKESSRYCSGSEHEAEKALAQRFSRYMHGELVGFCSLICAKLYEQYSKQLPELLFDSEALFAHVLRIYRRKKLIEPLRRMFEDKKLWKLAPVLLKKSSAVRRERFTLWNVVDSRKIDFKSLMKEIYACLG